MTRHQETPEHWQKSPEKQPNISTQGNSHLPSSSSTDKHFHGTSGQVTKPASVPMVNENKANTGANRKLPLTWWRFPWLNWKILAFLLVITSGGLGYTAMSTLLNLPEVPDCHKIFLPLASASMRLSCAQLSAEKRTIEDLLTAISLVESLPQDHPLRSEINRSVAEWSSDILQLAEKKFQAGEIEAAIANAREIPEHVEVYGLVEDQIKRWQKIWSEAEGYYQAAEKHLKQSQWNLAFREAVRLTYSSNEYWARVKYREMVANINQGRKDSAKLDEAYKEVRRGGVDNLLKAIEISQVIETDSYAYKEAKDLITDAGKKLLKAARQALDDGNWSLVAKAANGIPALLHAQDETDELIYLANAGSKAEVGTISSLETAIFSAEKIAQESDLYSKAQNLIARWKLEIQDVAYLTESRDLARSGGVSDLRAAISKAKQIPRNNPRYTEARQLVGEWTRQVQLAEDRPVLERASQLARYDSGVASLQDAVNEASRINSGSPLHQEAQRKIGQWNQSIQRQQDQPFLNQAERLADAGNLNAAIEAAQRIPSGRALHGDAQSKIRGWRRELQARQNLQRSYQVAAARTPESLSRAIYTAREVPDGTTVSIQRNQAINNWSYQILEMAQSLANSSRLKEAIKVAKMIPSGTAAYSSAQARISSWRAVLAPPVIIKPPIPAPVTEANFSEPEIFEPETGELINTQ